jgi:hypothetical protein
MQWSHRSPLVLAPSVQVFHFTLHYRIFQAYALPFGGENVPTQTNILGSNETITDGKGRSAPTNGCRLFSEGQTKKHLVVFSSSATVLSERPPLVGEVSVNFCG